MNYTAYMLLLSDLLCLAVGCELPLLRHAIYDRDVIYVGEIVTFSCAPGYRLPDNTTSRSSECNATDVWASPIVDCTGKRLHTPQSCRMINLNLHGHESQW